jgi:hypothetical protein
VARRSGHQRSAEAVDVAGAEDEDEVALAQPGRQDRACVVERRQPEDRAAAGRVGGRLGDQEAGDAGEVLGPLAGRVDVEGDRSCVRLKRCGWKQAMRRRGASERAAAIVAATSVGWWA